MKKPSTAALIPAAGDGTRLGLGPKALLCIEQRSLLDMLLTTVAETVDEIIVAAPASHLDAVTELVAGRATVVVGGADRQQSIDLLIAATQAEILLVHDAARPFATRRMFEDVITAAAQHGAAVTCVAPGVPVGIRREQQIIEAHANEHVRVFQAPQAFRRAVLEKAQQARGGRYFQSTAQMVLASGQRLETVPGAAENIKITTPLDWDIATKVIAPRLEANTQ